MSHMFKINMKTDVREVDFLRMCEIDLAQGGPPVTGCGIGAEAWGSGWRCLSLSSLWIGVCMFFLCL